MYMTGTSKQNMVGKKSVETYFSRKCPKSISLDSGHLDQPFGPLSFNFSQYLLVTFFDFLNDFWTFVAYFPGLGCCLIWSLLDRFGPLSGFLDGSSCCYSAGSSCIAGLLSSCCLAFFLSRCQVPKIQPCILRLLYTLVIVFCQPNLAINLSWESPQ